MSLDSCALEGFFVPNIGKHDSILKQKWVLICVWAQWFWVRSRSALTNKNWALLASAASERSDVMSTRYDHRSIEQHFLRLCWLAIIAKCILILQKQQNGLLRKLFKNLPTELTMIATIAKSRMIFDFIIGPGLLPRYKQWNVIRMTAFPSNQKRRLK